MREPAADTPVLSVSELNRAARELLEDGFPMLWVCGEISNFLHHRSGHMYFDLKDERAQVRCAMFRNANRRLEFRPEDGMQVLLYGRVTLYEPRGSFQLVAEALQPAGEGLLRQRFEALKAKLAAEGLFATEHHRPLPSLPRRIGVITSPTGAAVRDILKVLRRRFPVVPVVIYPALVQGEQAPADIVRALETAARRRDCDVLILGRGGGSLEDLWAFNDEAVVRAVHSCPVPVVSAVGHESDVTLTDFVADLRAPTPSAAAELVVPDARDWLRRLAGLRDRASRGLFRQLRAERRVLGQLLARLQRCEPGAVLRQHEQRLDELVLRLQRGIQQRLTECRRHGDSLRARLRQAAPLARLRRDEQALANLRLRLAAATRQRLAQAAHRLAGLAAGLQAVSPLATLERGYALVQDPASGRVLRDAAELSPGQEISARLARGSFRARVTDISKG
ncbi:MAG: exodeoxyribonuclease VII large subunit [Gammaproteobacteria bacterium]|nr:MAG: exodeoxyribonuclease VII large subunit [Gammaproteobacteria bacterium]